MSELKLEFVGKQVKDMYGTFMGKVVGITTDIDGSIEAVGIDCGSAGLKQLPYEQLLVQGDYVIYIPRWRLDAQKLIRQKSLTLKRIKALQDLVSENDNMKDDAEMVYLKYEKRLRDLEESEKLVNEKLQQRVSELDAELKSIKSLLFDAKLQYKSNEMSEETYQQVNLNTSDLMEHINLEKTEINNVKARLTQGSPDVLEKTQSSIDSENLPLPENDGHAMAEGSAREGSDENENENDKEQRMERPSMVDAQAPEIENRVQSIQDSEPNWLNNVIK